MATSSNNYDIITKPAHYANHTIEPLDYVTDLLTNSKFTAMEGALVMNIIKYISRFPYKGTPVEDVKKAQFYLSKLTGIVEAEYNKGS